MSCLTPTIYAGGGVISQEDPWFRPQKQIGQLNSMNGIYWEGTVLLPDNSLFTFWVGGIRNDPCSYFLNGFCSMLSGWQPNDTLFYCAVTLAVVCLRLSVFGGGALLQFL